MSALETPPIRHSAKYSKSIMARLRHWVTAEGERLGEIPILLDCYAGVGTIHQLADIASTHGHELEPEYAAAHPRTKVGDSRWLPWPDNLFDVHAMSPVYPSGMCDSFDSADGSERHGYHFDLGRRPSEGSAVLTVRGRKMTSEYRELHEVVYRECLRVSRPGALWLVNTSNHIAGGEVQKVTRWHLNMLLVLGLDVVCVEQIATPRNGKGANGKVRVPFEHLMVMRSPG